MVIGRIAFRPFIGAPPITLLITSFGVLLVIQYLAILCFGEQPRILRLPSVFGDVANIGSIRVPVLELITIGTAAAVVGDLLPRAQPHGVRGAAARSGGASGRDAADGSQARPGAR